MNKYLFPVQKYKSITCLCFTDFISLLKISWSNVFAPKVKKRLHGYYTSISYLGLTASKHMITRQYFGRVTAACLRTVNTQLKTGAFV